LRGYISRLGSGDILAGFTGVDIFLGIYISRVDLKVLIYFRGYIFTGANIFQGIY